jgi:Kdo2-lipid IVA lauroyltransferase/acyltransferase
MIPQSGRAADVLQAFFYYLLRLLPTEVASDIGSAGIRLNARLARPDIIENAKKNLAQHKPGTSEAELDAMTMEFLDGVGRVAAEFAVMHRFVKEGRVQVHGIEGLKAVAGQRPVLGLCVHTGNWEVMSPVFQLHGLQLNSIIAPPANAFERAVVERVRRLFGVNTILPDLQGVRQALRVLHNKGIVSMFPDEAREGHTMAPLFGRAPHDKGNLAIAAKLARKTGAALVLGHCRRIGKCRFELHFSEMFDLPPCEGVPDVLADVAFLNARIEPVVQANIPRWYFLDDSIAPVV